LLLHITLLFNSVLISKLYISTIILRKRYMSVVMILDNKIIYDNPQYQSVKSQKFEMLDCLHNHHKKLVFYKLGIQL